MQTPKTSKSGSPEASQRTSPSTPRSNRLTKAAGSESESATCMTRPMKNLTDRSPKVIQRRSPGGPVSEKKRPSRVTELECQLAQLKEDLKKTKDRLSSSDSGKRQAEQEAEEAKKQLSVMSAKYGDSQRQQVELAALEECRIQELRKISQERDWAWQSELEAIQNQRSVDLAALNSAMNEIQRLKMHLEIVIKSESALAKQSEMARSELQATKQEMAETLSTIENLKIQLRNSEQAKAKTQAMVCETQDQLEIAKTTVETLCSDGLKLKESFSCVPSELEKSRAQENLLEETVKKLQADQPTVGSPVGCSLESEVEQLRSALEAAEIKYQEEQIKCTVQIQSAYELIDQLRNESGLREAELELALKDTKAEIVELKEKLFDKETQLRGISDLNERLHSEIRGQVNQIESNLGSKLTRATADIKELKAKLMHKETELQGISEESQLLKQGMEKRDEESHKRYEAVFAEVESARAKEQEAVMRLGFLTEEADKSSRRAARVTEQLDAAQEVKSEMEAELRRLRVQSDQWRKAAEAAAAVLTVGKNGRFMERSGSLDSEYSSIGGRLMNSPFSDDLDDESPKKRNNNVLRRIGGLWKKGQK